MPNVSGEKPVAAKYAMDYYRRPLATRLWKRRWNWLALLFALLVTVALYLAQKDEAFQAGPVSPSHVTAGATCKDCHDQAWQPALRLVKANSDIHSVSDSACRECHQVADHHQSLGTEGHACATCHQEHRGEQMLIHTPDSQCVNCHGNLAELAQATGNFHSSIKRFSEHPEFAFLRNGEMPGKAHGVWRTAKIDNSQGGKWWDTGGVKFNHKVHLAKEGMLDSDRKPVQLDCAACHEEDASGAYMAPINYQQHCAACHPLRLAGQFESLGDLPHRQPEIVRAVLRERLTQQTVSNEKKQTPSRVPLLPNPTRLTIDQAKTVHQLLAQAEHAVLGFEAKGMCRKCHHVVIDANRSWQVLRQPLETPVGSVDLTKSLSQNQKTPSPNLSPENGGGGFGIGSKTDLTETDMLKEPLIPRKWLQHGRFDHSSHRTVRCDQCHEAASSERTADILLPSISACHDCHGAVMTTMAKGVGDSCVMCHDFHKASTASQ